MKDKVVAIFGGTGFIGHFLAKHLIKKCSKIYLLDIKHNDDLSKFRKSLETKKNVEFIECDVRQKIEWKPSEKIDIIFNFAAVHREPGHEDIEYFETNIGGANNVCSFADDISCQKIVFSSSISPYGADTRIKSEKTLTVPTTAYGSSKLAAEYIHKIWHNEENKQLIILRPGVVFGPTEGGNVSRLIRAVKGGYFFFMGNKDLKKAGIYVKEIPLIIDWLLAKLDNEKKNFALLNLTMYPCPTLEDYVVKIKKVGNFKKPIFSLPFYFILFAANIMELFLGFFIKNNPFNPVRIKKLSRPNEIDPLFLKQNKYEFNYNLEEAFEDWIKDYSKEW